MGVGKERAKKKVPAPLHSHCWAYSHFDGYPRHWDVGVALGVDHDDGGGHSRSRTAGLDTGDGVASHTSAVPP